MPGSGHFNIRAAAEAGNAAAQDRLAELLIRHGDLVQAGLWYRKAATQGYVNAQAKLGQMLLVHVGLTVGLKPEVITAFGSEAIKWLTLAANQGNTLAQAELAGAYYNGRFVKADLLEAYKWGDIAAKAPPSIPGSAAGCSVRDAATQKMSYDQVSTAKQRVATFYSHEPFTSESPEPAWVNGIQLSGVSGPANARLAIINNQTFGVGDSFILKVSGRAVQVHCLEIRDKSVLVRIAGLDRPKMLIMADDTIKR